MMAVKAALVKAGRVDKEAMIDALAGLTIKSPTGQITVGKNHHTTMNLFLAKTKGRDLVTVRALGEIAPDPGCK
jgi:branched-chain amino acid transport system substrate-binding protein/urea transport system substrate-binding protein